MSLLLAIIGVYFFVTLGFAAKRIFGEIHERTLVLLSVYFLQPILSFWGILGAKIDFAAVLLLAFAVLSLLDIDPFIKSLIFLQLCMPLAVNNVNLASLYDCKPYTVTANILASSLLFVGLIFVYKSVF